MNIQLGRLKDLRSSTGTLFGAMVVIVGIAMYGWIVAPHVAYLKAVQAYEPVVNNVNKERTRLEGMLKTRRERLDTINAEFSEIRKILFTFDQAQAFFQDLGKTAETYGCEIYRIDILTDEPKPVVGRPGDAALVEAIQASVSIVGYFQGLVDFVQDLQHFEHEIRIGSLKMFVNRREDTQLKCDLTITVYVMQEREAATDD